MYVNRILKSNCKRNSYEYWLKQVQFRKENNQSEAFVIAYADNSVQLYIAVDFTEIV